MHIWIESLANTLEFHQKIFFLKTKKKIFRCLLCFDESNLRLPPEFNCFSIESTCYNQFSFLPFQHFTVLSIFRSFSKKKSKTYLLGRVFLACTWMKARFEGFLSDNKLSGWDARNSLFVLFQFQERKKNWNFVIWMKRLETTRRKQKTSADGSELKMRKCCNGIELHIKRRQKITRRRNLNNFYVRL